MTATHAAPFALLIVLAGCGSPAGNAHASLGEKGRSVSGTVLGEPFTVAYADPLDRDLDAAFDSLTAALTASLSSTDTASAIGRFNSSPAPVAASADPHLTECMRLAQGLTLMTRGAFDATCWPLAKAWREARAQGGTVDPVKATDLRLLGGVKNVQLQGEGADAHLVKTDDRAGVVLDDMVRGYCMDRMADLLSARNVPVYLIELGSLRVAHGPRGAMVDGAVPADSLRLMNKAMAICVRRDRFDPRTGAAVDNGMVSATVLHDHAVAAEAIANALMVMGPNAAKAWLAQVPRVQAMIVVAGGSGEKRSWGTFDWPGRTDERTRRLPGDPIVRTPADTTGSDDSTGRPPTAAELRNARKAGLLQAELDRMSGKTDSIAKAEAAKKKEQRPAVLGH